LTAGQYRHPYVLLHLDARVGPRLIRVDAYFTGIERHRGPGRADGGRSRRVERHARALRIQIHARHVGHRVLLLLTGCVLPQQRVTVRDVDELAVLRLAVAQHEEVAAPRHGLQLVRARLSTGEVDHRDLAFRIRLLFTVIGPEIDIRVDEVRIVAAGLAQRAGLSVGVRAH